MSDFNVIGKVFTWGFNGKRRRFANLTMTFRQIREQTKTYVFSASSKQGEQRVQEESHVKKLSREILGGTYTPTSISLGLKPKHSKMLIFHEDGTFSLNFDEKSLLALTDGGHRRASLEKIMRDFQEALDRSPDDGEKDKLRESIDAILDLPIPVTLHLDGDPREDFQNLQSGRPVDRAHVLALNLIKNRSELNNEAPHLVQAFDIANELNKSSLSPFYNIIKFDCSKVKVKGTNQIPFTTLCAASSSDLSTSLVGMSKIAIYCGDLPTKTCADTVIATYEAIRKCEDLIKGSKVLTPYKDGGTKGSATMLIGVASMVLYRFGTLGGGNQMEPNEIDLRLAVQAAKETLDEVVGGQFSGGDKRRLMRDFASVFFDDFKARKILGVPLELCRPKKKEVEGILSPSSFALKPEDFEGVNLNANNDK